MDRDTLRSVQQPLKDRYADDPDAALVTLKAHGTIGEGITCTVDAGRALATAGLHPATGGDGTALCSGDMLLEALVGCAGVTMKAVATSIGVDLRGGVIHAEGDLDFRGTLAVGKDAPVGFRHIRVRCELDTDASDDELDTLLRLTERYCVVMQTLLSGPRIDIDRSAPAAS